MLLLVLLSLQEGRHEKNSGNKFSLMCFKGLLLDGTQGMGTLRVLPWNMSILLSAVAYVLLKE